jgi:thiamine biosynthesis protein ThiI
MQYTVKVFPEITIKSRPVRMRFIRMLCDNLRSLLKPIDPDLAIEKNWDRVQVIISNNHPHTQEQVIDVLKRTPGISNFLQVIDYPWVSMEDTFLKTKELYGKQLKNKTFAVRCKRSGEHSFSSMDVEYWVGGNLKEQCETAGVRLNDPDVLIRLEVIDDHFLIVLNRYEGLGGFPLGTQDAVLSLISGGFDSTVASYLTMKRGLLTHFCFFNLGGKAHEMGVKEVAVYLWMKYGASHRVKFITVPFEDVVKEILEKIDNPQMGVILKRMMLRAATRMAREWEIPALVTGESVAQVSSQTLQNLNVINAVTDMLVLRPLITTDKTDIIRLSRKIGTEVFAAAMPEYCGVISVKPTTRARPERIQREEDKFDFAILEQAITNRRAVNIDEIVKDVQSEARVEIVDSVKEGETIIDIRHPDEEELNPLKETHPIIKIPFYNLHNAFQHLDNSKTWLLYCEKGVMSQLHAQYLKSEHFPNVKVYRRNTTRKSA